MPECLEESSHCARPAGLVARAQAFAVIAVKVFVEQDVVAPMWIALEFLCFTVNRSTVMLVAHEDADVDLVIRANDICQSIVGSR
jgi:hypothetical protein